MKRDKAPVVGRDRTHAWANLIVGMNMPRKFIRSLSDARYRSLIAYVRYIWLAANDSNVRRVNRPEWLPKKYVWGDTSRALRS